MNNKAYEFTRLDWDDWETLPLNRLIDLLSHSVDYEQSKLCDNSNWEGMETIKLCLQELERRTR